MIPGKSSASQAHGEVISDHIVTFYEAYVADSINEHMYVSEVGVSSGMNHRFGSGGGFGFEVGVKETNVWGMEASSSIMDEGFASWFPWTFWFWSMVPHCAEDGFGNGRHYGRIEGCGIAVVPLSVHIDMRIGGAWFRTYRLIEYGFLSCGGQGDRSASGIRCRR